MVTHTSVQNETYGGDQKYWPFQQATFTASKCVDLEANPPPYITRLLAITFVLFLQGFTPTCLSAPSLYYQRRRTDLLARLFSLLSGLFGVRVCLYDIYTFVHPSSCECGSVNVLYPVTMKATYVLLCVGLLVLPATICQSPAERDSYTVSNLTISPCSFYRPLHSWTCTFLSAFLHNSPYIVCGIVCCQTSVCFRGHVPVNERVWVRLLMIKDNT